MSASLSVSFRRNGGVTHEVDQILLNVVGVHLDLEDSGLDAGVSQKVHYKGSHEVGNANVLDKALVHELLHGLPGFLKGDLVNFVVRSL